ncbi:MAG: phosphopyruvate hydratase [Devosia nanyangense]|uniref:Enolase n=1 Tax=Devosia nanyangense TaxID=1228055 RepID=A0A933L1I8_9HYPH|nr:phosphopyruvate hydratase [Devosia nanyangense]
MNTEIVDIVARQVWDSRGRPTIEVEVALASGHRGRAIAPSGASTGSREALDRRDGGKRLGGFGVGLAIAAVNGEIAQRLSGMDATAQRDIDAALIALDGTPQKSRLGGNAIVATSLAVAWAAAAGTGQPLWRHLRAVAGLDQATPHIATPMIQIFGGGRHADGRVDMQDFMVICPGAKSFADALEMTAEIYLAAQSLMKSRGKLSGLADEGGLWPAFDTNEQALDALVRAIDMAGLSAPRDVAIALDVAASEFSDGRGYRLALENRVLSSSEWIEILVRWCDAFPIVSIEDPAGEDDDAGFTEATRRLGGRIQIVGDDYLTTSAGRIAKAAARGAGNAALLKVNQCGTISELIAASATARRAGWNTVQSGRSGESEDVSLAHLAVGLMSDQIKVGSIARSERTAKWNEMLRIEEQFGAGAFRRFRIPAPREVAAQP